MRSTVYRHHLPQTAFFKITLSERPQENYYHVTILQKVPQNFESRFTNKSFIPEYNFEKGFLHCKNVSKGNTYFPEKSKLVIFHFRCTKPKQNCTACIMCIAERQTLEIISQICLIFKSKVLRLPPMHMQKAYSK